MSPVREASLTAVREIRRNIGSAKGIAMFILFLLGGVVVPRALERFLVRIIGRNLPPDLTADDWRLIWEQFYTQGYGPETGKYLSNCPSALYWLFWLTTVFTPFIILVVGFDQLAGDIQYRTIRYIVGRSRRESIVVGKALGMWVVISVMLAVLNITVWVVLLASGASTPAAVLSWGPRIWLFSVASCAAFVGFTSLLSSIFRTPIVALFAGMVTFFLLWVLNKALMFPEATRPASWALPFRYEDLLVSHDPLRVLAGFGGYLAWGAATVAAAALIMKRKDV